MKIVLDISMTEYKAMLSSVEESAKAKLEKAEALSKVYDLESKLYQAKGEATRAKEEATYQRNETDYYRRECQSLSTKVSDLRSKVSDLTPPGMTMEAMGKLLAEVREAGKTYGTFAMDDAFANTLLGHYRNGAKISMIKEVRTKTGCGLKEAKDLVEGIVFGDYNGKFPTTPSYWYPSVTEVILANMPKKAPIS